MNLQDRLDKAKEQLTLLEAISCEIKKVSELEDERKQIMDIIERFPMFNITWGGPSNFRRVLHEIYKKYNPTFSLPRFEDNVYGLDWVYTKEHDYLLLKLDTSEYNTISITGFTHLFNLHEKKVQEHTTESTYSFIMDCIQHIQKVAEKMLALPIFDANKLTFLSLMQHYYIDYDIDPRPILNYITDMEEEYIYHDFKRMVFETNGGDPLSVRGSLPVISHYARKKALGRYNWSESDPSLFVENMRSNKALNLRKAFDKMESYLNGTCDRNKEISFLCTVGVHAQEPNYGNRKRLYGISAKPTAFSAGSLKLGILSTCMNPRSSSFNEQYIGWINLTGGTDVYDRYEDIFDCLEDNIVDTLEDNYNFLLEKLPTLRRKELRNDMLEYIMEGF